MTLTKEVVEFANALHIQDDVHLKELIAESREIADEVEAGDEAAQQGHEPAVLHHRRLGRRWDLAQA